MTTQELVNALRDVRYQTMFVLPNAEAVELVEADRKAVADRIIEGMRTEFFNPDSVVAKDFLDKVRRWANDVA